MRIERTGILFGFGAALFQSLSYLCTKLYLKRHADDVGTLLALSHIIMGLLSVLLVLCLQPRELPPLKAYLLPLAGTAGFYLLGQFFLFAALIRNEASRISPLLGLKIIILALISAGVLQQPLGYSKWLAVACCSLATLLLSQSGKRLRFSSLGLVVLACLFYSLSDLNIKILVDHFRHMGIFKGAMLGTGLTYILCGAAAVAVVIRKHNNLNRATWGYSVPFALAWLAAMVLLFACFAHIGVVFGNIIQSTRGILSIALGVLVSHLGFERLEPRITRMVEWHLLKPVSQRWNWVRQVCGCVGAWVCGCVGAWVCGCVGMWVCMGINPLVNKDVYDHRTYSHTPIPTNKTHSYGRCNNTLSKCHSPVWSFCAASRPGRS